MTNAVKLSPAMRIPDEVLQTICGFTFYYDCPSAMQVCKAWSRVFTPYNAMQYSDEMEIGWLAATCPPRNRPGLYYRGVEYDIEHANLRMSRAYQLVANAQHRTFTSLSLSFPIPECAVTATQLFNTQAFGSVTDLFLASVPSRELVQGIQKGCPSLKSVWIGNLKDIGAKALCEELNACENLKETTLSGPSSDDDLQKLQKLNSLTWLHVEDIGRSTTAAGLRHLADGYSSLRALCLSGGMAEQNQPVLLARPWVQHLVELESLAFRLQSLRLGHLTKAESACVATQFLSKTSKLQALEFQCSDLDPGCMQQLPKCPSLTDLNFACGNKGVTDVAMQSVAQCAKLRFLEMDLPDEVDLAKGLKPLIGHKAIEDLTIQRDELRFSPSHELLQAASDQIVSIAKTMPVLRVLQVARPLHPFVVKRLPNHNVYVIGRPPREKYTFVPEKLESKQE